MSRNNQASVDLGGDGSPGYASPINGHDGHAGHGHTGQSVNGNGQLVKGNKERLRQLARAAIQSGKLPAERVERFWGGPGIGASCSVCGEPVRRDQLGFEFELPPNGSGPVEHHFHFHCFAAWELECHDRAQPQQSDGLSDLQAGDRLRVSERGPPKQRDF